MRVIALDDFFLVEDDEGEMVYEYDEAMVASYRGAAAKALRKAIDVPTTSADFSPVIVVDAPNLTQADVQVMCMACSNMHPLHVYTCASS